VGPPVDGDDGIPMLLYLFLTICCSIMDYRKAKLESSPIQDNSGIVVASHKQIITVACINTIRYRNKSQ